MSYGSVVFPFDMVTDAYIRNPAAVRVSASKFYRTFIVSQFYRTFIVSWAKQIDFLFLWHF